MLPGSFSLSIYFLPCIYFSTASALAPDFQKLGLQVSLQASDLRLRGAPLLPALLLYLHHSVMAAG